MPNLTNLSVDILVLILRFAVVLLLYFFLWQVLRFVMRDLRAGGQPAGNDEEHPPEKPQTEPYKTHLAYVKERRSDEDGAAILAEAIARLRARRGE